MYLRKLAIFVLVSTFVVFYKTWQFFPSQKQKKKILHLAGLLSYSSDWASRPPQRNPGKKGWPLERVVVSQNEFWDSPLAYFNVFFNFGVGSFSSTFGFGQFYGGKWVFKIPIMQ